MTPTVTVEQWPGTSWTTKDHNPPPQWDGTPDDNFEEFRARAREWFEDNDCYIVKTTKNTTTPRIDQKLTGAEVQDLIEVCGFSVTIVRRPK